MRRHKAWRGGSNAQQSCVPATALKFLCVCVCVCVWRVMVMVGCAWKYEYVAFVSQIARNLAYIILHLSNTHTHTHTHTHQA